MDVAPYRGALASKVGVPAVVPFRFCLAAASHALNLRAELFQIVGMEAGVIRLDAHFFTKHSLSEQVVHAVILQVKAHHVVAADVECHLHRLLLVKHILRLHTSITVQDSFSFRSLRRCRGSTPMHSCPFRSLTGYRWYRPSGAPAAVQSPDRDPSLSVCLSHRA